MFCSLQSTRRAATRAAAISSCRNYCYRAKSGSLLSWHKRSYVSSNSTVFPSLICFNELSLSQRSYTSTSVSFDSRRSGNINNHATDINETIASSKQIKKEKSSKIVTSTTTAPMNHRAAGAIMKQITSIPNILTLSRITATPYLSYLLITHHQTKQTIDEIIVTTAATSTETIATNIDLTSTPFFALSLFLAMGFTDFLDGYIARKYPSTATVLGTYLDPFADKVLISVLSMTLWYTETLPGILVSLWIARDVGMVFGAYYLVKQETMKRIGGDDTESVAVMDPTNTPIKVEASLMSKVNTALQIGLIALGIAHEVPGVNIDTDFMTSLCWITCGTTVGSTIGYLGGTAFRKSGNNL